MGFGVSHQHVGINRCGEFLKTARTKGPSNPTPDPSPFHREGGTATKPNEPWRRISDLVGKNAESRDPKLRKRCARKLVRWIERKWGEEYSKERAAGRKIEITQAWDWDVGDWARVAWGGLSLEGICFRLGMSERALSLLLRETLKVSGRELLDGFCLRRLRASLIGQLRMAAQRLWDSPGEFAKRRCMRGAEISGKSVNLRWFDGSVKRSKYFRTQPREFLGLEHGEDEALRVRELLGMLDRIREENDFDGDAFAVMLGFESGRRLRRACLNVMGRTLKQIERILAREVVEFYLAAEDRELREICFREDEFGFRAREIYCGDAERVPEAPFGDRWSAWVQCKPEWIERMRLEFG